MKKHIVVVLLLLGQLGLAQELTTYYLIRHAEKNRSDSSNRDPHLNAVGLERAENWSKILQSVPFDVIYATPYHRTKETAQPIAAAKNLPIELYHPGDLHTPAFTTRNKGKIILVVGHSNTTAALANKLLGKERYPQIDDRTNGNLYILQVSPIGVSCQLLSIE